MAYKIFRSNNYFILIDEKGNYYEEHCENVFVTKDKEKDDTYDIAFLRQETERQNDLSMSFPSIEFTDIQDENGDPYASVTAWETWYEQNTGVGYIALTMVSAGLATESTLLDVLAAIDAMRDFEVRLAVDSVDVTWLEVRYWDVQSGALGTPVYYAPGSTTPGTPTGSLTYINPNTYLAQLVTNTTGLNLEATQLLIKGVLDAMKIDTAAMVTDLAAIEVLIQGTNNLLTTIDAVLDTIKLDTANLDVALSTRATEATLAAAKTTLDNIKLDTANLDVALSTRATEATLAAQAADIATIETNIALLNAKFNTFGRKPEANSTPFAIDQEAYDALVAIQTAVQNIDSDLGTGGLALDTTVQATNTLLTTIDAVLDTIKTDTGAMVVDLAAIEVLITNTNALLTTIDGVLDAIKLDTANLDVTLSSRLNTLGRKAETASAPVVLSDEDFASLEAIRVAVQNLDVDVDGIATEVTLAALLAAFNAEDFASQTTLAALAGTDFATQTTLAALLAAFNAEDFASQTTLQALLTAFNAEDFSTETTLAALLAAFNAEDFATETTLNAIKLQTDQMSFDGNSALEVSLPTGTQASTYQVISGVGSIVIPAGKTSISCLSYGAGNCTVDTGSGPVNLASGIGLDFEAEPGKTLGSITFAGTILSSRLAITTVG